MSKFASYIICTAPRSGSTLLCRLLAATGVAGKPASYFYDPTVEEWCVDLGLPVEPGLSERERLDRVLAEVLKQGRNGTGVFGLRQQAPGLAYLCEKLAVLFPREHSDAGRFGRAFGRTLYVHLRRADKIDQAVSLLRAQQTGLWHVAPDGSELERIAPHQEPVYDGAALRDWVETLTANDQAWDHWFAREGIAPVRITYDELSADPVGVVRDLMGHLGLDRAAAEGIAPGVRKLADETSAGWVARFRAESGLP